MLDPSLDVIILGIVGIVLLGNVVMVVMFLVLLHHVVCFITEYFSCSTFVIYLRKF